MHALCRDWIYYKGWGEPDFLEGCTHHRAAEVRTALRLLRDLNARGSAAEHVSATCAQGSARAASVLDGLAGRLDVDHVVLCGHSYGGATVAGAAPLPPLRPHEPRRREQRPMMLARRCAPVHAQPAPGRTSRVNTSSDCELLRDHCMRARLVHVPRRVMHGEVQMWQRRSPPRRHPPPPS